MHDGSQPRPASTALKAASILLGDVTVTRYSNDAAEPMRAYDISRENAFMVMVQLSDSERLRLWNNNQLVHDAPSNRGTLSILDLREPWRCEYMTDWDSVWFQIPIASIRNFAEKAGRPQFEGLACVENASDDVVLGISQALLPSLEQLSDTNPLFLEQIGLALLMHLTQAYGGLYFPPRRKGTLAPWQEKRAVDFLINHLNSEFAIADLAAVCDLSRSYFIKAFKETFGTTPYRWLINYRVVKAKDMLHTNMPIAEIAAGCGFADQSHFTRTFSEVTGLSPGNWRRQHCSPLPQS